MQNKIKHVSLLFLSILIGAAFIYSSYTKTYTLESFQLFEFTIIEYLKFPWLLAIVSSRLLVGIELSLGVLIIFRFYGNLKWVLKLAIGLLAVFNLYLVYLWIIAGNNINCGCFGDAIWMSPASSLAKNFILILGIWLLIKYQSGIHLRWAHLGSLVLLLALSGVPYALYPIPDHQPQWLQKQRFQPDLSAIYEVGKPCPPVDLSKGKHIIAFLSLSCPHCQMAGYKMHLMKQKNPTLPFHMVVAGKQQNWKPFWDKTKAQNIPYTRLESEAFTNIAGYSWPVIYWLKDGWVEAETNFMQMDQGEIEKWLEKP
ncbi:MAG: hypothetical protein EOP56_06845 [Sphingobacteriales bacterium]|nr:MAG: hypothetical protein EOP56_06845 [Sphingobacteriales bacterium]